jgi:alpha-L-fucosidase
MNNRCDWFRDAGYGMMLHWGVYSAIGRGEWVLNRERMPLDEYRNAAADFTAAGFDADAWAELAVSAGMRYLVVTAKHHDGFCLWDSATTPWCATRCGPRRDLIAEIVAACRRAGLRVGFFFSLADWMHPAYPTPYAVDWPENWRSDADRRELVAFAQAQVAELLRYGPDIMWFDGAAPGMDAAAWDAQGFHDLIRAAAPGCLINQRLFLPGDFSALEMHLRGPDERGRPYESDWTLNGSWAWNPGDRRFRTPLEVVRRLLTLRRNDRGNLLLNVSPDGAGRIDPVEAGILRQVGDWLARVGGDLLRSRPAGLGWVQWGEVSAVDRDALLLHCWSRAGDELIYAGCSNRPRAATLLDDGRQLAVDRDAHGRIRIAGLRDAALGPCGCVVRLDLDGPPIGWGVGHADLNF